MTAASIETPPPLRIGVAERALRAGVLPTDLLAQVSTATFVFADLNGASAPRAELLMPALARLRGALRMTASTSSAPISFTPRSKSARAPDSPRQRALLFVDDASAILPASNWGNWSTSTCARCCWPDDPMRRCALVQHSRHGARWPLPTSPISHHARSRGADPGRQPGPGRLRSPRLGVDRNQRRQRRLNRCRSSPIRCTRSTAAGTAPPLRLRRRRAKRRARGAGSRTLRCARSPVADRSAGGGSAAGVSGCRPADGRPRC